MEILQQSQHQGEAQLKVPLYSLKHHGQHSPSQLEGDLQLCPHYCGIRESP